MPPLPQGVPAGRAPQPYLDVRHLRPRVLTRARAWRRHGHFALASRGGWGGGEGKAGGDGQKEPGSRWWGGVAPDVTGEADETRRARPVLAFPNVRAPGSGLLPDGRKIGRPPSAPGPRPGRSSPLAARRPGRPGGGGGDRLGKGLEGAARAQGSARAISRKGGPTAPPPAGPARSGAWNPQRSAHPPTLSQTRLAKLYSRPTLRA